jgi:hypothetical protein
MLNRALVSQSRKNFEDEFKMISDSAKEHGMAMGEFLEKFSERLYVSCPVIAADGSVVGRQSSLEYSYAMTLYFPK